MLAGERDLSRRSFETARLELEEKVAEAPDDARFHSALGIAYAAWAGRKSGARSRARLRTSWHRRGMPGGLSIARRSAPLLHDVGQSSEAIAQLDDLLARSGWFTAHILRLDPRWDPRGRTHGPGAAHEYEFKP